MYNHAMSIYQVIPGTAIPRERSQIFTYRGPAHIAPGTLVEIPLGRKTILGLVWEVQQKAVSGPLKSIQRVVQRDFLSQKDRALLAWMAAYYAAPLTQCFRLFLLPRHTTPKRERQTTTAAIAVSHNTATPAQLVAIIRNPTTPALIIDEGEVRKYTLYQHIISAVQKNAPQTKVLIICPEISHVQALINHLGVQPQVVIGTRSIVFQRLDHLGAIIIDSENNAHFKNEEQSPHYDARTIATYIAMQKKIPLFFESSTPRVTTYYYAKKDRWPILRHATKKTITTTVVDTRNPRTNFSPLTEDVVTTIGQVLARGEKVLCYVPRRGLARSLFCIDCHHIFQCPHCTLPLAVHKSNLLCHHCGFSTAHPIQCPQCMGGRLQTQGAGIEHLSQLLKQLFPKTPLASVDRTTIKTTGALQTAIKKISKPGAAMLVGTDLILRPLDLPQFGLVVMAAADGLLFLPDFSASEQLFATISALRRTLTDQGQLLCLTAFPENTTLQESLAGKFEPFFRRELIARKQLAYPPFVQLVTFTKPFTAKSDVATIPDAQGPIRVPQRGLRYILKRSKTGRNPLPPLPGWWIDVDPVSLLH